MSSRPPVQLSALRDIGWSKWDPIGLSFDGGWHDSNAADDDAYLLHVVQCLQNGEPDSSVADYLVGVETDHMGISLTSTARPRAVTTVAAIREYAASIS